MARVAVLASNSLLLVNEGFAENTAKEHSAALPLEWRNCDSVRSDSKSSLGLVVSLHRFASKSNC
jgi:hypothetical protein